MTGFSKALGFYLVVERHVLVVHALLAGHEVQPEMLVKKEWCPNI